MPVLPSYLELEDVDLGGAAGSLNEYTLRIGEVVAALAPNDPKNKGPAKGKQWVYIVNVMFRDSVNPRAIVPYRCTVAQLFGGVSDHVRHRVRKADVEDKTGKFGKGARVLVLCPNGDKTEALIIGGVHHPDSPPETTAFLDVMVNGVSAVVGEDGSLTLRVAGPTKNDGTPVNSEAKPSSVTFKPDGSVEVTAEKVSVNATTEAKVKTKTAVVEGDEVTVKAKKVNLGDEASAIAPQDEVVVGSGIDTFTGTPYFALGSTSKVVKAKKQ